MENPAMQAERGNAPVPPRPIEGRVAQVIVEYTGAKLGSFTIRGPATGHEYRFDASRWHRLNYVLIEDLDRFEGRHDFQILPATLKDPETEERERREKEIADLRQQLAVQPERVAAEVLAALKRHPPTRSRRASGKVGGRPPGKGLGALLDCWMTCGGLADCYGSATGAYDAIHGYLEEHNVPGIQVAPRERLPSLRSDAKRKREGADGNCLWHKHPEPVPAELAQA